MDTTFLIITSVALIVLIIAAISCVWVMQRRITQLREQMATLSATNQSLLTQQAQCKETQQQLITLQAENIRLSTEQKERATHHQQQLEQFAEQKQLLKKEFENLANSIFEEKSQRFSQHSQTSLDALLRPLKEQIDHFQKRVNDVHADTLKGHTSLEAEIKKVQAMGLQMRDEASNLATALKGDNKAVGNWGEVQLEQTLQWAGLEEGVHYQREPSFKTTDSDDNTGNRRPDFVLQLPDNKQLVIDSKVSLADYDRAVAATVDNERQQALRAHVKAVRQHIDDLAKKDYSNLLGLHSPNFVFLFMPIEPAYIAAVKQDAKLFNYAYHKGVVLVSHTTLMPMLRTVANLWTLANSHEAYHKEAREMSDKAGDVYQQLCTVVERLGKLGGTLNTASTHYNNTLTALTGKQGLCGKLERFKQLSSKVTKSVPVLEPLTSSIDDRLLDTEDGR